MPRINAGKYRHIVTFQELSEVQNTYGETSVNIDSNWKDTFQARVGIFPISSRELLTEEFRQAEISHRVVLRYMPGISSKMRIKFGTRIFEIITAPVNAQERDFELVLFCKERDVQPTR
jgi:SPP1 family predicted phage head-tail adaptor